MESRSFKLENISWEGVEYIFPKTNIKLQYLKMIHFPFNEEHRLISINENIQINEKIYNILLNQLK